MEQYKATTVLCVRHKTKVVIGSDGQVSFGDRIMKANACKVRRLYRNQVIAGFAGTSADAFTLFELFEKQLEEHGGRLHRAAVDLAKQWRTERALHRLEALLVVADASGTLMISGNGDVLEPDHPVIGIGSGGSYAQAVALALLEHTELDATTIVRESLRIASDICIYTNQTLFLEELQGTPEAPAKEARK